MHWPLPSSAVLVSLSLSLSLSLSHTHTHTHTRLCLRAQECTFEPELIAAFKAAKGRALEAALHGSARSSEDIPPTFDHGAADSHQVHFALSLTAQKARKPLWWICSYK